jgi:hypothetical protein
MNPPQGSPDRSHALVRYRWPLVIVAVAMMVLLAYVASLWTSKEILTETMDRGGRAQELVELETRPVLRDDDVIAHGRVGTAPASRAAT